MPQQHGLRTLVQERLLSRLNALRKSVRAQQALRGAAWLVAAILLAATLQLVLDRTLKLGADKRIVLNLAITGFWLVVAYRVLVRPLLRPLSHRALAARIDALRPDGHESLQTAIEFAGAPGEPHEKRFDETSPELLRVAAEDAVARYQAADFREVIDHKRAQRRWWSLAGMAACVAFAFLAQRELMVTWFTRNCLLCDRSWPQATYIVAEGFDSGRRRFLPRGEDFELSAVVEKKMPRTSFVVWRDESGATGRVPMTRVGDNRLTASLGALTGNLTLRIEGGDEVTEDYSIIAVDRPRIVATQIRVQPPAYVRSEPIELTGTTLEVLRGSTLSFTLNVNHPLTGARLIGADGGEWPCITRAGAGAETPPSAELFWAEPRSGAFHFALVDQYGLENRSPVRYAVKVAADQPPTVQLTLAGVGELVTPQAVLRTTVLASDTYGVGAANVFSQRNEEPEMEWKLAAGPAGRRRIEETLAIAVAKTGARAGDKLRIVGRAEDLDPAGPNRGESEARVLSVVTREDFELALMLRERQLRAEFERLISAERALIDNYGRLTPPVATATAPDAAAPPQSPRIAQQYTGLIQRQSATAVGCGALARNFSQILEELRTNQIAKRQDERRVNDLIVAPLMELETRLMPQLSEAWSGLRKVDDPALRDQADRTAARVLGLMQAVLKAMSEWEGYRETVGQLQEIIDQQQSLHEATIQALERQINELLDEPDAPANP